MSERIRSAIVLAFVAFVAMGFICFREGQVSSDSKVRLLQAQVAADRKDPVTPQVLLDGINKERTANNVGPLEMVDALTSTANLKLQDMLQGHYYDHVNPKTNKQGYTYISDLTGSYCSYMSENLAKVDPGTNPIDEWNKSKPHHDAEIDPRYDYVGFAAGRAWDGSIIYVTHFCETSK